MKTPWLLALTMAVCAAAAAPGCWSWRFPDDVVPADAGAGGEGGEGGEGAGAGGESAAGAGGVMSGGAQAGMAGRAADGGVDAPDAAPVGCTGPEACQAPSTPVCDTMAKVCRACRAHRECASGLCTFDGKCPPSDQVLHVAKACTPNGPGTARDPLCTLTEAVTRGTPYVLVGPGQHVEAVLSKPQQFYGTVGAVIVPSRCDALTIRSKVVLAGFTIEGNVLVAKDSGAEAQLRGNVIHGGSGCIGVQAGSGTKLLMDRNFVHGHGGGGLETQNATYVITNNVFAHNGAGNSAFGGVRLGSRAGSTFAYNTVSANEVRSTGMDSAGGVRCDGENVVIASSIIWGNAGLEVSATCTVANSVVDQGNLGLGNVQADPLFKGGLPDDIEFYRLRDGSPALDKGTTPATPDYFGTNRGANPDLGAIER